MQWPARICLIRKPPHNAPSRPLFECLAQLLQRGNLILVENIQGLAGIAKSARDVGDDALQSGRDGIRGQHIGLAGFPDHTEIILGHDLVDRNQLEIFGPGAWTQRPHFQDHARAVSRRRCASRSSAT